MREIIFTQDQIKQNKEEYITLIQSIKRENCRINEFVDWIQQTDFFVAPASSKYHYNVEGGLCAHTLNVYHNLKNLVDMKKLNWRISDDTILICSLLHDISKVYAYEKTVKNVKTYCEEGTKHDELGNFEWESKLTYTTVQDNFFVGNHEESSEYIARMYFSLTAEESSAIMNHHGGLGYDSCQGGVAAKSMTKYPTSTLLHLADCISAFLDESQYEDLSPKEEDNE